MYYFKDFYSFINPSFKINKKGEKSRMLHTVLI